MRRSAEDLLKTYLGERTGERVLAGRTTRGEGEKIHAVILLCDLRDSTALSQSVAVEDFFRTLNEFFDCTAGAVLEHGGEVLSYIGDAVFAIEVGQVTDIVESPMGFHILTREPIVEFAVSHILIQFKGSTNAQPTVIRTQEEAKAEAEKVAAEAKREGADFAALARKYSDDPSGEKGGSIGIFLKGQLLDALDGPLSKLTVGEISPVVETKYGFHILKRDPIERVAASP